MAAGPSYFCRHKSNQKGFQQKGFFAAQAFTLQISQNHGLQKVALFRSLVILRFSKYYI